MSIVTEGPGRFCNQVIRSWFASILAGRLDLAVDYAHGADIRRLGAELFSGSAVLPGEFAPASDDALLDFLEGSAPPPASKLCFRNDNCYFQSRRCSARLREWLLSQAERVRAANPFAARYRNNSEVFLHVRLGDASAFSPGIDFFRAALARVGPDPAGCISSDSPDHPLILQLVTEFPRLRVVHSDDLPLLILFASTFAHVVLSHGSFSAVIGFLAFDSTVYYAPYNVAWCGDMFSQPDWVLVQ